LLGLHDVQLDLDKLLERVPCREMIGRILTRLRCDDPRRCCYGTQALEHIPCMCASGIVSIRDDDDIRVLEILRVVRPPLASATGITGGDTTGVMDGINVLLTLGNKDRVAASDGADQLRQAIRDTPDAI